MHINFFHKVILPKQKKCLILLNSKVAFPIVCCDLSKKKKYSPKLLACELHYHCKRKLWSVSISNHCTPDGPKLFWITGFLLMKQ